MDEEKRKKYKSTVQSENQKKKRAPVAVMFVPYTKGGGDKPED